MKNRKNKMEMPVATIENGVVIDHIPPSKLFKVVALLGLEDSEAPIMIGNNLKSNRLGKKGIIKISDIDLSEDLFNRIALVAPSVRISTIRNFDVVMKNETRLPGEIIGLVACNNSKCITNNEPMKTRFINLNKKNGDLLECAYCGRKLKHDKITLL